VLLISQRWDWNTNMLPSKWKTCIPTGKAWHYMGLRKSLHSPSRRKRNCLTLYSSPPQCESRTVREEVKRSILTTLWRPLPRISFLCWMLILRYISMSFLGLMLHVMFSEADLLHRSTHVYIIRPTNLSVIAKMRKGSGRGRSLQKCIHKDNRKRLHIVLPEEG